VIVPMRREHIAELMPYEREMFATEAWSADSYRDELADRHNRHYVAAVDAAGHLLGWAGVRVLSSSAEILTVGVIPAARRQGIATKLLAALLDEARARAAEQAFLEVRVDNEAARSLYLREGFSDLGIRRGYYDGGRVDAVTMRKGLDRPSGPDSVREPSGGCGSAGSGNAQQTRTTGKPR
jgi:[ribosomal protein S18]-alanine N-acetyltransferase